jgi:hypothetical protein
VKLYDPKTGKTIKVVDNDPEREAVNIKNRDEMVRLMEQYNLTIKANDFHTWRPTQRDTGDIPGVWGGVEIIATNGLLGYFVNSTDVYIGHIQKFTGEVKPLNGVPRREGAKTRVIKRKKSKKQLILESI